MAVLSDNILREAENLTEATSITLFEKIQILPVTTSLSEQPIQTSSVVVGNDQKPAILLLHGFDSSVMEYRRLLPLLCEDYQVWLVDLLGFGFTQRQTQVNYSPATIKTHLYHFWQSAIAKPVILVGASMGGATAIDFSLSYPEAVEQLILLDGVGLSKQPVIGKFLFPPLGFLATEFLRNRKVRQSISRNAYFDPSFANEDALVCTALHLWCENWHKALISFTKSCGYGSFAQQLHQLSIPSLIIWGKNDRILGVKPASQFHSLIPQSKLIWIENCGHVPHLEQAQVTAQHISQFIANSQLENQLS